MPFQWDSFIRVICCFHLFCTQLFTLCMRNVAQQCAYIRSYISEFNTETCVPSVNQLYEYDFISSTTVRCIVCFGMTTKTIRHAAMFYNRWVSVSITETELQYTHYLLWAFLLLLLYIIEMKQKILFLTMHTAWGTLYTKRSYAGIHSSLGRNLAAYCSWPGLKESLVLCLIQWTSLATAIVITIGVAKLVHRFNSSNCKSKSLEIGLVNLNK